MRSGGAIGERGIEREQLSGSGEKILERGAEKTPEDLLESALTIKLCRDSEFSSSSLLLILTCCIRILPRISLYLTL